MGVAMSADARTASGGTEQTAPCWCCGRAAAEEAMVRLHDHPEVGVCVGCVRFLDRKARDLQASQLRHQLRKAADSIRGQIMSRGWHERPVVGPALIWVNRHLPW